MSWSIESLSGIKPGDTEQHIKSLQVRASV